MSSIYTCISCRVAFKDADIQRQHYKTDWHRYNLKRKVAELPSVTAEEFQRRVIAQREKDQELQAVTVHCKLCRKTFNSQNAFDNHLNSKKHKDTELQEFMQGKDIDNSSVVRQKSKVEDDSKEATNTNSAEIDSDDDIEEVDSDEWDDTDNPIADNNCLFCPHHSKNMAKNLKHMSVAHSFFIPDAEYVVDMKGLLMYLGEKVTQGHMCLWCSENGKSFQSAEAAQQHMVDKGHCKMIHEGETLIEYDDFYDYSKSYPSEDDPDEEVTIPVLDDTDYFMILPSGAKIGHRSLMRYFRQSIDPNRAVVPQKKVHRILAQYRALGWTETNKEAAAQKARDVHYMKRVQSKYRMQLGVKANKFQKHFRPQVNF